MENVLIAAMGEVVNFHVIMVITIGVICGIIAGCIPGFTVTMGIVLAFPFTFAMEPIIGLALMMAILVGGYTGGLISGIILGIPGTPSSITTLYDGHPMAKNNEVGRALGIGILSSFIGTLFSVIVLSIFGPLVAKFSLNFGPWEIAVLIILALTMVGSLSEGAMLKGLMAGGLGLLFATVGYSAAGQVRFDFGFETLTNGLEVLPILIGCYAFSQLMGTVENLKEHTEQNNKSKSADSKIKIPYGRILKDMWVEKWNAVRSALIGSFIGGIPAVGGETANFVSYDQAKKASKKSGNYGKGEPGGIVAAEVSNNSVIGGALIPTLTLGIPGNIPMAIMFGVLILHGITPGPTLFRDQPILVGSIYFSLIISSVVMLIVMFLFIRVFAKISQVPPAVLVPVVLMLAAVGSYALNNNIFDIWTLFIFGILGYLFVKAKVPLAPLILGVVLGAQLETNILRAIDLEPSIIPFFTRPVSLILIIFTVLSVLFSIWQNYKATKKASRIKTVEQKDY